MTPTKNDLLLRIRSGAYEERAPEPDDEYLPSYDQELARYEGKCAAWRRDVEAVLCPETASPRLRDILWTGASVAAVHMEPRTRRCVFLEAYERAVEHVRVIAKETGGQL